MRRHFPPIRRFLKDPHGTTYHERAFFIVTAEKTSNLTKWLLFLEQFPRSKIEALHGSTQGNVTSFFAFASWELTVG
jgi:hypothetical protein